MPAVCRSDTLHPAGAAPPDGFSVSAAPAAGPPPRSSASRPPRPSTGFYTRTRHAKTFRLLLAALLPLGACNTDEDLIGSESQPNAFTVVEWTPAPGQFIGENDYAGPDGVVTAASAAAWAQKRLEAHQYVSLGGFGGSITVRFAHPIAAGSSGYDFAIRGNAIDTSNEPGIVWVMTDRNGNGRPDDTWYELRGSETGKTTTFADYEVTYYRPDAPQSDVRWTDNRGGEGRIEYLPHHHRQDSYYPAWIEADRYTLKGTRLEAHNRYDEGKNSG